jgi:gliding motility-associated-like protein
MGNFTSTLQNPQQTFFNTKNVPLYFNIRLRVTSDSGCTAEVIKNNVVTVYPLPEAGFSIKPAVASINDPLISFQNNSRKADSALWDFGDQHFSGDFLPSPHQYKDTGRYVIKLLVYTEFGCRDSVYKEVIIQPDFTFFVPDAFTPNGDGINDTFSGKGTYIREYSMTIFNRWGNIMFQTEDPKVSWNGSKNNEKEAAAEDVYIYTIQIVDCNKKKHFYQGTITLIR